MLSVSAKNAIRYVLLFLAGSLFVVVVDVVREDGWLNDRPELVADLSEVRDQELYADTMENRLLEKFPIGSDANSFTKYLSDQGFRLQWGNVDGISWARYFSNGLLTCPEHWDVGWSFDSDDKLTKIEVGYADHCS